MLDTTSLRENTKYPYRREFVIGLLILNALYWQQSDEDLQSDLNDDYATPLTPFDYELFTFYGVDLRSIPHFRHLSNVQRINSWYDMYVDDVIKVSRESRVNRYFGNCVLESSYFALLAILIATVENELKYDISVQSKVNKFSRRIAIYGYKILTLTFSGSFVKDNVINDFPLTFDEVCSLIPLEYEVRPEENYLKKKYGSEPTYFEKPREQLIEELRFCERENYKDFFYENVPYHYCDKKAVKRLLYKYGEEYLRAAYSVDTMSLSRWGELFCHFGILESHFFTNIDYNDINSNLIMVKASVEDLNREFEVEDKFGNYEPVPVDYFLIKDYVAGILPREQAMPRLVQLVLYRLYVGESFKLEDIDKLSDITTPLRSALSVQSALTLAAYRCGVLLAQYKLLPCGYGKAVIDELFPSLDTFFQRGMSVARTSCKE